MRFWRSSGDAESQLACHILIILCQCPDDIDVNYVLWLEQLFNMVHVETSKEVFFSNQVCCWSLEIYLIHISQKNPFLIEKNHTKCTAILLPWFFLCTSRFLTNICQTNTSNHDLHFFEFNQLFIVDTRLIIIASYFVRSENVPISLEFITTRKDRKSSNF